MSCRAQSRYHLAPAAKLAREFSTQEVLLTLGLEPDLRPELANNVLGLAKVDRREKVAHLDPAGVSSRNPGTETRHSLHVLDHAANVGNVRSGCGQRIVNLDLACQWCFGGRSVRCREMYSLQQGAVRSHSWF